LLCFVTLYALIASVQDGQYSSSDMCAHIYIYIYIYIYMDARE
jgi:hypothetical protein